MRPSVESVLMATAWAWAERATCPRLHVGAVLARDGRTISTGYNGPVSGAPHCGDHSDGRPCARAVHAEANVIAFAARHGVATAGTTLFVTHSPCVTCARLLVNAGVVAVVFGVAYRSLDGVDELGSCGIDVRKFAG